MEGPILTDLDGNIPLPILKCSWGEYRCKHLGVHDWHYFYCSAQDADNCHPAPKKIAYPWLGAGKQLRDSKPDDGCPFKSERAPARVAQ